MEKLIYMTDTDLSISETEDKITVSVSAQRSLMSMEISPVSPDREAGKKISDG